MVGGVLVGGVTGGVVVAGGVVVDKPDGTAGVAGIAGVTPGTAGVAGMARVTTGLCSISSPNFAVVFGPIIPNDSMSCLVCQRLTAASVKGP